MTTFDILWKCLPFFILIGYGLNLLLAGIVPSWRAPGWRHWKIFADEDNSQSLLVQLGFEKANKPVNEGDFSEKTAARLYTIVGSALMLLGAAAVVWIAYLNPRD